MDALSPCYLFLCLGDGFLTLLFGNTLGFLPPFILYCFLQKQFVEGIALSGTKG